MAEKKKILLISDHPLLPSGVGSQAKYLIEGLLATGKYKFVCLGGAIKHPNYNPQKVEPAKYNDDWLIYPVDGYGDKKIVRQMLMQERPDAMFIFTDPRFFVWCWEMEDEIHSYCPLVYWHVWDNDPTPKFNRFFYESTDFIAPLSLKTYGLLQDLDYPRMRYIPHSLPPDLFKPLPDAEVQKYKHDRYGPHADKKFILFWNNRNARRKQTGDVVATFAAFAERVGRDNVALMMHTAPKDPEGQDLLAVADCYKIDKNMIISQERLPSEEINRFLNVADCTINIASNEGFGLGTLESLFAGTPIIAHMTGGLQFQLGDWWEEIKDFRHQEKLTAIAKSKWQHKVGQWFGVPVFPGTRSCTGSQPVPYIYDDKVRHEDVVEALVKLYDMGRAGRKELGLKGREWALRHFTPDKMIGPWDECLMAAIEKFQKDGATRIRTAVL